MSKDLFGKESRGVSKNISASNSKDSKDLQPLLPNFLNPEKLPNFSNNFPNFGKKSEDHGDKSSNNETKSLTSFDVLKSINNKVSQVDDGLEVMDDGKNSLNNGTKSLTNFDVLKPTNDTLTNSINKNVQINGSDFDVKDFVNELVSTPVSKPKSTLFEKFCQDPSVPNQLIDDGRLWLESICGEKIHHLILDGRWHYTNKKKKAGYKGTITTTADGKPLLKLQYNDFSNGGFKDYFDSSKALGAIYQDWKIYNAPAKSNKNKANSNNSTDKSTPKQQSQERVNRQAYLKSLTALRETRIAQQAFDDAKEAAAKKASLEKHHKLWASLPSTGNSNYLIRKALASIQTEANDFIRYGDGGLGGMIIPLCYGFHLKTRPQYIVGKKDKNKRYTVE